MAETLNTPSALSQPIAQSGDKNTIPVTNDQSLGLMSQSTGFPPITSTRIADGGKAPRRADFNGAFNLLSQQHYFFQNGGTETFRQEVSDAIGGYPLGARLWYTNSEGMTVVLRSLIQNNTYNFNTNSAYIDGVNWEVDIQSGAPVGSLMPYAGTTPPDGWLICDGSEISRTSYSRLFAVIGTTYGAGDGNSSFNLPNFTNMKIGGIPDYSAGISVSMPFTAPSDGVLKINTNGYWYGFINGSDIGHGINLIGAGGGDQTGDFILPKGTVISLRANSGTNTLTFYPLKGNNPPKNYLIKF